MEKKYSVNESLTVPVLRGNNSGGEIGYTLGDHLLLLEIQRKWTLKFKIIPMFLGMVFRMSEITTEDELNSGYLPNEFNLSRKQFMTLSRVE